MNVSSSKNTYKWTMLIHFQLPRLITGGYIVAYIYNMYVYIYINVL
jgi:hypothetical protein